MYSFILEGADGTGKTTLAQELVSRINGMTGYRAIWLPEPNNMIEGLRDLCLRPRVTDVDLDRLASITRADYDGMEKSDWPVPEASIMLMLAGMAQTKGFLVKLAAALKAKQQELVVIRDRSVISTLVYQAILPRRLNQIDVIWSVYLKLINERHTGVIFLDSDDEVLKARFERSNVFDTHGYNPELLLIYRKLTELLYPATGKQSVKTDARVDAFFSPYNRTLFASYFPIIGSFNTSTIALPELYTEVLETIKPKFDTDG